MESKKFLRAVLSGQIDLSGIKGQQAAVFVRNPDTGKYKDESGKEWSYKAISSKIIEADGFISAIEVHEKDGTISKIELLEISAKNILEAKF